MRVYHLTEIGEISPPALTPLYYGRYLAPVRADGTVVCDNLCFSIDAIPAPPPGEEVMIWCSHDYFCCPITEYEQLHH